VAWFPLGPREPYYPAYHVSNTYIQQMNITHVTNINVTNVNVTNIRYVNQQVPGAVIAAPQNAFTGARPIAGVARPLNRAELAQVQVVGAAPSVAPVRESVLAGGRMAVARPSQAAMARPVVARATPPPPAVSFQAKQEMLRANQGRPLDSQQINEVRRQDPRALTNREPVRPALARPMDQAAVPPGRLDSRPPSARPFGAPVPENRAVPAMRPLPEPRRAPEPRQIPAPRPAPEGRPAPEVRERPAPAAREDGSKPKRDQREEKDKEKDKK
jgi:hypothetical protein